MFWCFNKASNIDRKETHIYKEKADTRCLVFSTTFNKKLSNLRQCFDVLIRPRTLTVKKPIYTRRKLLQNVLSFPQLSIKSYQILGNVWCFNKASNIDRKETHIYKEKADTRCLVFSTTFNKKLSSIRQYIQGESWYKMSILTHVLGNVLMF